MEQSTGPLATLTRSFRSGREDCIRWAQELDAGLTKTAIAGAFGQLGRLDNNELPTPDPDDIRTSFALWRAELDGT